MKKEALLFLNLFLLPLAFSAGANEEAPCATSENCESGYYCEKPESQCHAEGTCEARPEYCPNDYRPVCGCDDQTYSNSCHAASAGANVKHQGECAADLRKEKRCNSNGACEAGYFCEKPPGACDSRGECQVQPEYCTQQYDPVCGCDRMTYSNACSAHAAGVNVQYEGEC